VRDSAGVSSTRRGSHVHLAIIWTTTAQQHSETSSQIMRRTETEINTVQNDKKETGRYHKTALFRPEASQTPVAQLTLSKHGGPPSPPPRTAHRTVAFALRQRTQNTLACLISLLYHRLGLSAVLEGQD